MNAVTVSVNSYVHPALLHLENPVSLDLSSTSRSHFSTPSSHRSLSLEAQGMIKTSYLGMSAQEVLTLCMFFCCGSQS